EGSARWRLHPEPSGTRLEYEQDVRTRHRLMNLLTPIARRAFVANHRAMMRGGEAGLRRLFEVRRRRAGSHG
ncbi:MAG TPA: polyketide cyclase, partial [Actinomycetota bacterium]|nr:polyketide cyclase [Actinomycetota bacterium]